MESLQSSVSALKERAEPAASTADVDTTKINSHLSELTEATEKVKE